MTCFCSQIIHKVCNLAWHPCLVDDSAINQKQELTIFQSLANKSFAILLKSVIRWDYKRHLIIVFCKSWSHKHNLYFFVCLFVCLFDCFYSPSTVSFILFPRSVCRIWQILLQHKYRFYFLVPSILDMPTLDVPISDISTSASGIQKVSQLALYLWGLFCLPVNL